MRYGARVRLTPAFTAPLIAAALLSPPAARAQSPGAMAAGRDVAEVVAGWDHVPVIAAGWAARGGVSATRGWSRPAFTAGLTVPLRLAAAGDAWRLGVGGAGAWRVSGHAGARGAATVTLARAADATGRRIALGVGLDLAPGRHARRSVVAADLGLELTLATHLRPSAMVRDLWNDRALAPGRAARDGDAPTEGWHAGGASRLRAGLALARTVGDGRTALVARLGAAITPNALDLVAYPMLGQLPFYARAGVTRATGDVP